MSRAAASNTYGAGVYAVDGLRFGAIQIRDCIDGCSLNSTQGLVIGSYQSRNVADRRTGNDTSSVDLYIGRCDSVHIGKFDARSVGTGSTTRSNASTLAFPNGSSNVKILDVVAQNGNGSNFAVDWSNCTNIVIGDFRNAAGTSLTPVGTVTANGSVFRYGLT